MISMRTLAQAALLVLGLGIVLMAPGCVVTPPAEGYYDRDHHRWWHEHAWVECGDHDDHCR
jgi:hypothetical protein